MKTLLDAIYTRRAWPEKRARGTRLAGAMREDTPEAHDTPGGADVVLVRCQDVKMSGAGGGGWRDVGWRRSDNREMSRCLRCQDVSDVYKLD